MVDFNITSLINSYRARQVSPTEKMQSLIDEIYASDLNCFISVDRDLVLKQARVAEACYREEQLIGPLCGVPIAIKDLIDVAGMRTTMGSEQYAANLAKRDAQIVKNLRAQGAIILGKANTHEFAFGSTGDRSYFGQVRNPRNPKHMSGGSSSGSAGALGAGLCAGALGTDTSASVRLPAALCGVVGLKPTFDLLSRDGVFALSHSLDHVGPMSTTVKDNALLLNALTSTQEQGYERLIGQPLRGLTVGILGGFYTEFLDDDTRKGVSQAAGIFEAAGAHTIDVEIPQTQTIYEAQQLILNAEAYFEHRAAIEAGEPFQDEVLERLKTGSRISTTDYIDAIRTRTIAISAFGHAFENTDILMAATCGTTAPPINQRATLLNGRMYSTPWLLTRLTAPCNLSGNPALSVPHGHDRAGLPIGIQLIGKWNEEARLFQFGAVLEKEQANSQL